METGGEKVSTQTMAGPSTTRVAVIGAGVSGLAAAQKLFLDKQNAFDVNIYEGTNRIGGRINTCKFGKGHVERGAAWIHGCSPENPLYHIAIHNKLGAVNQKVPKFVMSDIPQMTTKGELVPLGDRSQLQDVFYNLLEGTGKVRADDTGSGSTTPLNGIRQTNSNERSVGGYVFGMLKSSLDKLCQEDEERRKLFLSVLRQLVSEELISNGCSSLFDLDLDDFDSYKDLPGGDFPLPAGYGSLLDSILMDIPESKLHLNKSVTKIEWMENSPVDGTPPVRLEFQDGDTAEADIVLVTASLGFLKNNASSLFQPSLPDDKLRSIQSVGFGVVNKIQLQYNQRFWEPDWKGIRLLWDCGSVDTLEGDWSVKDEWFKRIPYIRRVFFSEDVLEALIAGEEAKYVEELDPKEVGKTMTDILRKFLSNKSIPEPDQVLVSKWSSNPHVRGSYSYISCGASSKDLDKLAEPVTVWDSRNRRCPRICFAGEATSKHYYSTVHGALLSGRREADRLIAFNQSILPPAN